VQSDSGYQIDTPTMSHVPRTGGNLVLAASLALLSYVPFEYVAKATILVCVVTFVLDPFPPYSRLLALMATMVVALLTKWHRDWQMAAADDKKDIVIVEIESSAAHNDDEPLAKVAVQNKKDE
jgi:hypothetical protein